MIFEPNNPSDNERYELLKLALSAVNRSKDFDNIIQFMSPPPPITSIMPKMALKGKRIGIIGAGCAGLVCAYELRKLGCDITILEANKDRIGGRVYTYQFGGGLYGELGAMRTPVSHETTWHYINELKLDTNPFIQMSENNILYVKNLRFKGLSIDNEVTQYLYPRFNLPSNEQSIPLSKLVAYVYNEPITRLPKNIRPEIIAIRKQYPQQINFYDQIDFRKNCELLNLSNNAIDLVSSVIGTDSGFFYFNFLEILKEYYPASFSSLYEITGGFYKLPYAFNESFKYDESLGNVSLEMGMRVTEISEENNQVRIRYLNQSNNTFYNQTFDTLICTIPFSTLRLVKINPLFSNRKMEAIREVNYSPSQKTLILFNERFWEKTINQKIILGGRIITDFPMITAWFPSHLFQGTYGVILTSYNMNLDATRLANTNRQMELYIILRQLEETMGLVTGYLNDKVVDFISFNWNINDLSLGAFAKYYPGQNELFAYASFNPEYNNKVFFAGEHVGPSHGWMQSALLSGAVAANLVAQCAKQKTH